MTAVDRDRRPGCVSGCRAADLNRVSIQLLRIGSCHGLLRWHSQTQPLCGGQSPDQCARLLAGLAVLSGDEGVALHSTSWRHEGSQVMLTYALFPAGDADIGWTPLNEHLAVCQGPLQPSPEHVGDRHVAAHAARHLSDLATGRDPHLTRCAELRPYEWNLLRAHAATVHVHSAVVVTG